MQNFNVITFIASLLRGTTQGNMTSQRKRTVAEMTHAQAWLPSPTADPHSRDCYMNTSCSMHNTQSRLPVNDNDVITLGATIGTFEAVVFFFGMTFYMLSLRFPYRNSVCTSPLTHTAWMQLQGLQWHFEEFVLVHSIVPWHYVSDSDVCLHKQCCYKLLIL